MNPIRGEVLLAVMRALLGAVTPNLRGVTVGWDSEMVQVLCLYHGPTGEVEKEVMNEMEAELMADFPELSVSVEIDRYDEPQALKDRTLNAWIYSRFEQSSR